MKSELPIYEKWKMNIYGIAVIVLVQSLSFPILYMLLKEFDAQSLIRNIIIFTALTIYIIIDIDFIYNRIYLVKKLLNKEPIRCMLDDVILIPYKDEGRTYYQPYPIVRSKYDNKLYMTYGDYSLINFTHYIYSNGKTIQCTLYRSDRRPVNFGDDVDIYILKKVSIPVSINRTKNKVKLKGKNFYYNHVNDKIDIDVFKEINYFKGIVDLDAKEM